MSALVMSYYQTAQMLPFSLSSCTFLTDVPGFSLVLAMVVVLGRLVICSVGRQVVIAPATLKACRVSPMGFKIRLLVPR